MKIGHEVIEEAKGLKKPESFISGSVYKDRANIGVVKFYVISPGSCVWSIDYKRWQKIAGGGWETVKDYVAIMDAGVAASGGKFTVKRIGEMDLNVVGVVGGIQFDTPLDHVLKASVDLTDEECKAVAEAVTKEANKLGYKGTVEARP